MLTVLLGLCPGPNASGIDLADLTGAKNAGALLAGEKPVMAQFNNPETALAPNNGDLKQLIEAIRRDLEPSVMVETLHLYRKPPEAEKNALSKEEEAGLYNSVLALSTLAGLQYYSVSRGAMRTFYETSSRIDGPSTKKPVPDPVYPVVPSELTIYARQKDLTFGDNLYQYDYLISPGAMIFTQQNLTSLTRGIILAVGKNNCSRGIIIIVLIDIVPEAQVFLAGVNGKLRRRPAVIGIGKWFFG